MPFVSDAQRRWGNSPAGKKALGGQKAVDEWNASTKGLDLPERKAPKNLKKKAAPVEKPAPILREIDFRQRSKRNG